MNCSSQCKLSATPNGHTAIDPASLCLGSLQPLRARYQMARARILIADDHVLVAEAFRSLLAPAYEIVGVVTDGRSLISLAKTTKPDAVLLDLGMPLFNGIDAGRELKSILPKIKIIALTMNEDPEIASIVLRDGASGYLLKKGASRELLQGIAEVLSSKSYVTP